MVYITLDTCIWLELVKVDFNQNNNLFDEICFWIENNHIVHITPQNIIREWDRNKSKKIKEITSQLKKLSHNNFNPFKGNQELMNAYNPNEISKILMDRFERVEDILKSFSEIAFENEHIYQISRYKSLEALVPNHNGDSFRDTINIYTLIEYLKIKNYRHCIFSTLNYKDFSKSSKEKHKLHMDLEEDFRNANLEYVYCDNHSPFGSKLFGKKLRPILPSFQDYLIAEKQKKEEESLASEKEALRNISNVDSDYFSNIKHLDVIISKQKPTEWELKTLRSLIVSHTAYEDYFFKEVETIGFYNFIQSNDYLNHNRNPRPIKSSNGYKIPFWNVLAYLEKLSIQISISKDTSIVDKLLSVIENVSENPSDNHRTWYYFIKILCNIPNEKITPKILNYIPRWLSGQFDTMLQTSEICNVLLPKLLNKNPTKLDIQNAELIIHYLFQLTDCSINGDGFQEKGKRYQSRCYLYYLKEKFSNEFLLSNIARFCSNDVIFALANSIKILILDYPALVRTVLVDGVNNYSISAHFDNDHLNLSFAKDGVEYNLTLTNWCSKAEETQKMDLIQMFHNKGICYEPHLKDDDIFQRVKDVLLNYQPIELLKPLYDLNDRNSNPENTLKVFSLIFRDLLNYKILECKNEGLILLQKLYSDRIYGNVFFKRITLNAITENWDKTKFVFINLLNKNQDENPFFNTSLKGELYTLLIKNQAIFNSSEIKLLAKCIKLVEQTKNGDKDYKYSLHRWYSALRDIDNFNVKYLELSKELNINSDSYESLGKFRIRSGDISPLSTEAILAKTNQQISVYIQNFSPSSSGFSEPNVNGLAQNLEKAVKLKPNKFISELDCFKNLKSLYLGRIINGVKDQLRSRSQGELRKILEFCKSILDFTKFNELKIASKHSQIEYNSTIRAISDLLCDLTQSDDQLIDSLNSSLIKDIIIITVGKLQKPENIENSLRDSHIYLLNSTAGKSLTSLFYFSLYKARNSSKTINENKWDFDLKELFQETQEKGIPDGYIMEGIYLEQFYFLDDEWIISKIQRNLNISEIEWRRFFAGLVLGRPLCSQDIYKVCYSHYKKALEIGFWDENNLLDGVVNHLTAFYIWQFEALSSEGLLYKFVKSVRDEDIGVLIRLVGSYEDQIKDLSKKEKNDIQIRIIALWNLILERSKDRHDEVIVKNLALLSNWIIYIPKLNRDSTDLILKSCKHLNSSVSKNRFLTKLMDLSKYGDQKKSFGFVGEILLEMRFNNYLSENSKEVIQELVRSLYFLERKAMASKFCNKMAVDYNHFFLRRIHDENN